MSIQKKFQQITKYAASSTHPADAKRRVDKPVLGEIAPPDSNFVEAERRELEIQHSEVRYRRLFETAKDGILILDGDTGRITDANPFLLDMLGYSEAELIGKALWEIGPVKDIPASQEAMRHLQDHDYIRYEDLPLETKAGERKQVEFVSNV